MYIKRLALENIRSYKNQVISFPRSSIMLSGDIGSGKSTILQAIEFALFGLRRSQLSGNSLLRNGEKEGSVELNFKIDTKDIVIKRKLKRSKTDVKQTDGYIIIDGVKKDLMPIEMKTHVLNLLNYPKDQVSKSKDIIFRYTVYTPQEEMKRILTEKSEDRLNTLRKVFDIDKYKVIQENISIFVTHLKQEANVITGYVADLDSKINLVEQYLKDRTSLELSANKFKVKLQELNFRIKSEKEKHDVILVKLKQFNSLKNNFELNSVRVQDCDMRISQLSNESKNAQKDISDLKDKKSKIKINDIPQIMDLDKNILELEKKLMKYSNDKTELSAKIRAANEQITLISKGMDESKAKDLPLIMSRLNELFEGISKKKIFNEKLTTKELRLKSMTESKHNLNFTNNSSKEIIQKISKLNNCPTCLQSVSDEYKHLVTVKEKEKQSDVISKLKIISEGESLLLQEISALKKLLENVKDKEQEYSNLKIKKQHIEEYTAKLIENKKVINLQIEKRDRFISELNSIPNLDNLKTELFDKKIILKKQNDNKLFLSELRNIDLLIKDKEKQFDELSSYMVKTRDEKKKLDLELIELKKSFEPIKNIENEDITQKQLIEKFLQEQRHIELELTVYNSKLDNIESNLLELNKEVNDKKSKKLKLSYYLQLKNWLDSHFSELMSTIEKQVLLKAYYEFNSYFQKWFNLLMEDETMSVRLAEDFSVVVEQNGYETDFDHLSGGEKTSCALAYRLALNKVINEINSSIKTKNLIILDEPTDGFSTEQLDKIREVLDDLSIKQVIIVSHENKIESYVDNVIRINKINHISNVV